MINIGKLVEEIFKMLAYLSILVYVGFGIYFLYVISVETNNLEIVAEKLFWTAQFGNITFFFVGATLALWIFPDFVKKLIKIKHLITDSDFEEEDFESGKIPNRESEYTKTLRKKQNEIKRLTSKARYFFDKLEIEKADTALKRIFEITAIYSIPTPEADELYDQVSAILLNKRGDSFGKFEDIDDE